METLSGVSPEELFRTPPVEIQPPSNQLDNGEQQPEAEVKSSADTFLYAQKTSLMSALGSKLEGSKSRLLALAGTVGIMVYTIGSLSLFQEAGISPENSMILTSSSLLFFGMRQLVKVSEKDDRRSINHPNDEPK